MSLPIDVFSEIRKLSFPPGQFIVVGSPIMAVKGIRPAYDLDIVVTQTLFDSCLSAGWELKPWTREGRQGKAWLHKGTTDLMLEIQMGDKDYAYGDLLEGSETVQGIPFMSLSQLALFKKEYGRPKDHEDIRLIEEYLRKNES